MRPAIETDDDGLQGVTITRNEAFGAEGSDLEHSSEVQSASEGSDSSDGGLSSEGQVFDEDKSQASSGSGGMG